MSFKKICLVTTIYFVILFVLCHFEDQPTITTTSRLSMFRNTSTEGDGRQKFTILFWTPWYSIRVDNNSYFTNSKCASDPSTNFIVSSNKSDLDQADVILFQYEDIRRNHAMVFPHPRKEDVPWVLVLMEAANNIGSLNWTKFNELFNWTWTFGKHGVESATHIQPFFKDMFPKLESPDEKWTPGSNFSFQFLRNKTKGVAWVVSNCGRNSQPSRRQQLVRYLRMHGVPVDIFGKCGNKSKSNCPRGEGCFKKLGKTYKFYFAAENSLCVNYITEKIYHGLSHNMVPILYGIGDPKVIAPPNSYIDALTFPTVYSLAKFIIALEKDPWEYFKYFEWKRFHNLDTGSTFGATYICSVYKRLEELVRDLKKGGGKTPMRHTHSRLKRWFNFYYDEDKKQVCNVCVPRNRVNILYPHFNKVKCKLKNGSYYKQFWNSNSKNKVP